VLVASVTSAMAGPLIRRYMRLLPETPDAGRRERWLTETYPLTDDRRSIQVTAGPPAAVRRAVASQVWTTGARFASS
jgi:hypothetical protein